MDSSLTAALGLGLLLGFRHATDADHVAAVSTLVSQHRSLARSCVLGAFWGAGHTLALFVAGVAVIAFKFTIPPEVERRLETLVAFVLILLGGHVLLKSLGSWTLHRHAHFHDGHAHSHLHLHFGDADSPYFIRISASHENRPSIMPRQSQTAEDDFFDARLDFLTASQILRQ